MRVDNLVVKKKTPSGHSRTCSARTRVRPQGSDYAARPAARRRVEACDNGTTFDVRQLARLGSGSLSAWAAGDLQHAEHDRHGANDVSRAHSSATSRGAWSVSQPTHIMASADRGVVDVRDGRAVRVSPATRRTVLGNPGCSRAVDRRQPLRHLHRVVGLVERRYNAFFVNVRTRRTATSARRLRLHPWLDTRTSSRRRAGTSPGSHGVGQLSPQRACRLPERLPKLVRSTNS